MARADIRQANFSLPVDLIEELRRSVPKREQSKVVAEALRKELKRIRLRRALSEFFGAWGNEAHPELEKGVERHVREMRHSSRVRRESEK